MAKKEWSLSDYKANSKRYDEFINEFEGSKEDFEILDEDAQISQLKDWFSNKKYRLRNNSNNAEMKKQITDKFKIEIQKIIKDKDLKDVEKLAKIQSIYDKEQLSDDINKLNDKLRTSQKNRDKYIQEVKDIEEEIRFKKKEISNLTEIKKAAN